ncbi:plasmid partitioning protein RepB [Polycladidibacter stylochi]|uniref:plasmid partitioning protein RepB n=1 Tax=Polycladidibacter stylochi TaxID=1807766 RepID=UPI00082E3F23|nr:plasmid partitioning protein RepB [Pseudovibrio stylochi]
MTKAKDRKNALDSLFASGPMSPMGASGAVQRPRLSSGAIGAAEINLIKDERDKLKEELKQLSSKVEGSAQIVELDTQKVLPSFIADRMEVAFDPAFEALKESISETGQQVPILVRPAPKQEGCYQIAYGHRRWRACQALGIAVKGTIRELTDEELLIAQGQENHERKDLSFIETCLFVRRLAQDYPQSLIVKAIGKDKSLVSKYRRLAETVPELYLRSIGPAPKIGRPRWEELASFFQNGLLPEAYQSAVDKSIESEAFVQAASDDRFVMLLQLLQKLKSDGDPQENKSKKEKAESKAFELPKSWSKIDSVAVKSSETTTSFTINHRQTPGLKEFLLDQLPELLQQFDDKAQKN